FGPTRYGPSRCCSSAATFRSTYTMIAAEFSSMKKTKSVRTIWATNSGVIDSYCYRDHEGTKARRRKRSSSSWCSSCLRVFVVAFAVVAFWSVSSSSHRLGRSPVGRQRAPSFFDVRFVLVPEVLQRRQDRR